MQSSLNTKLFSTFFFAHHQLVMLELVRYMRNSLNARSLNAMLSVLDCCVEVREVYGTFER
jgi:hypothetical protein